MTPGEYDRYHINSNTQKLSDHEERLRVLEKAVHELSFSMRANNDTLTEGVRILSDVANKLTTSEAPTKATTQLIVWIIGALGLLATITVAGLQKLKRILEVI